MTSTIHQKVVQLGDVFRINTPNAEPEFARVDRIVGNYFCINDLRFHYLDDRALPRLPYYHHAWKLPGGIVVERMGPEGINLDR